MSYSPASNLGTKIQATIESIAEKRAREIRHADNLSHDPEGQRVKALLAAALWDLYEFMFPKPSDVTVVTTQRDAPFVVHGLNENQAEGTVVAVASQVYMGVCAECGEVHDPRKPYSHVPKPPVVGKKSKRHGGKKQ